ncbi:Indole-3-acetic acid-induced protein ARG7 [Ananas comosus]|uniref:Indole-3-acetic acid-induced protein ARG7 n=1 Tax=Ananas comosus TaxID=4615 RepID=A0A199UTT1_ANACO|nr:Indole-3-acetic acid-induced protein ARG7 [Ananas comosus]
MRRWRALAQRGRGRGRGREPEPEPESNRPVRAGFMAVYVGQDRTRFVIPARLMNLPVFASLLELAEEEYGFQPVGGLVLPCEPGFFRRVLDALDRDLDRFKELGLGGFVSLFAESDRFARPGPNQN